MLIDKATDCSKAGQSEVICKLAKHHMLTLDTTLGLWASYMRLTLFAGVILLMFGLVGFAMPLFGKPTAVDRET
jgi:hypothetical protein